MTRTNSSNSSAFDWLRHIGPAALVNLLLTETCYERVVGRGQRVGQDLVGPFVSTLTGRLVDDVISAVEPAAWREELRVAPSHGLYLRPSAKRKINRRPEAHGMLAHVFGSHCEGRMARVRIKVKSTSAFC